MFLHRYIIILSVFVCYAYAATVEINCEKFPYFRACRGSQTKRRYMNTKDNTFEEPGCSTPVKLLGKQQQMNSDHVTYNGIPKSKLWTALLESGLNADALLEAYAAASGKRRNHHNDNKSDSQRLLLQNFSSELDTTDGDY